MLSKIAHACHPKPLLTAISCVLCAILLGGSLGACHNDNTQLSTKKPLGLGRSNAVLGYLAQNWQITQINNIPISHTATLDLTQITQGKGVATLGNHCKPILITFDVSLLEQGLIKTSEIERELDDCSDSFEDRLMSALSDVSHIQKDPNKNELILKGYQDTLWLMPLP